MVTRKDAATELLRRRRARANLVDFSRYTHHGYVPSDHHFQICEKLEAVARGEIKRLMIFMPPRHGKSELASRRFPAWFLGNYPERSIIAASYNSELARDFGRDVRNILSSEEYEPLFDTRLAEDSKAADRWHTNKNGGYVAAGVGTAITGRGAHILLIDDPLKDRESADSELIREKTYKWYLSTAYTRLEGTIVDRDSDDLWNDQHEAIERGEAFDGAVVLIQTRWHEDDLAGRLLRDMESGADQWEILSLPAIDKDNKPLWPAKYPLKKLEAIRRVLSSREWQSLYQQDPAPDEGVFFNKADFKRFELIDLPHGEDFIASDFATTEGAGDYTEHGVFRVTPKGDIYIHDWHGSQTPPDVWIESLLDLAEIHGIKMGAGETGPIKNAIEPFLKRRMLERRQFVKFEWFNHSEASKEQNARGFQALSSSGRVHVLNCEWGDKLINQLTSFPAGRYDDKVDVCSLFAKMINKLWSKNAIKLPEELKGPVKSKQATIDEIIQAHKRDKKRSGHKRI